MCRKGEGFIMYLSDAEIQLLIDALLEYVAKTANRDAVALRTRLRECVTMEAVTGDHACETDA